MEKYYCQDCKYSSDQLCNFKKHMFSNKHKQKIGVENSIIDFNKLKIKIYTCEYCKKEYTNNSAKSKHKKKCKQNPDNIIMPNEIKEMHTQINALINVIQSNSTAVEKSIDVAGKNADMAKKSMNMLKYATVHFPNAPVLKKVNIKEAYGMLGYDNPKNLEIENEKFVKLVLGHYENKNIHNFLGNLIVNYYKEDNVKDMSFWSADVSRLCFVIMHTVDKNEKKNE